MGFRAPGQLHTQMLTEPHCLIVNDETMRTFGSFLGYSSPPSTSLMFRRKYGGRNIQTLSRNTWFGQRSAHVANGVHRLWLPIILHISCGRYEDTLCPRKTRKFPLRKVPTRNQTHHSAWSYHAEYPYGYMASYNPMHRNIGSSENMGYYEEEIYWNLKKA